MKTIAFTVLVGTVAATTQGTYDTPAPTQTTPTSGCDRCVPTLACVDCVEHSSWTDLAGNAQLLQACECYTGCHDRSVRPQSRVPRGRVLQVSCSESCLLMQQYCHMVSCEHACKFGTNDPPKASVPHYKHTMRYLASQLGCIRTRHPRMYGHEHRRPESEFLQQRTSLCRRDRNKRISARQVSEDSVGRQGPCLSSARHRQSFC